MSSDAASAHIPNPRPRTSHSTAERSRRAETTAVTGARSTLMKSDVAITLAGGPEYPIRTNPDAMLKMVARLSIVVTGAPRSI